MPRGGRNRHTWSKGNGVGRGGPAKGTASPFVPLVPGDARQGARAENGDLDEQQYRASRRRRIRELKALGEDAQVEVIEKARALNDLSLQSQAADRLLARLPAETLDDDAATPAAVEAMVKIYLPERLPEPE